MEVNEGYSIWMELLQEIPEEARFGSYKGLGSYWLGNSPTASAHPSQDTSWKGHYGSMTSAPWEAKFPNVKIDVYGNDSSIWAERSGFKDPELARTLIPMYLWLGLLNNRFPEVAEVRQLRSHEMTALMKSGQSLLNRLCIPTAKALATYSHGAIGGELRHHKAVGGTYLPETRKVAWAGWFDLIEQIGVEYALECAIELFEDFPKGSYGGPKWAICAEELLKFERGESSPLAWIDRCVNLQHNTGSFLNKFNWSDFHVMNDILLWHSSTQPPWFKFENAQLMRLPSAVTLGYNRFVREVNVLLELHGKSRIPELGFAMHPTGVVPNSYDIKASVIEQALEGLPYDSPLATLAEFAKTHLGKKWALIFPDLDSFLNDTEIQPDRLFWSSVDTGYWEPTDRLPYSPALHNRYVEMADGGMFRFSKVEGDLEHSPMIYRLRDNKDQFLCSTFTIPSTDILALFAMQNYMKKYPHLFIRKWGNPSGSGFCFTDKKPKKEIEYVYAKDYS